MLSSMEPEAGLAERFAAQFAAFGMSWAERRPAVGAECLRRAATRCAEGILHTSYLDNSTKEIVHASRLHHC